MYKLWKLQLISSEDYAVLKESFYGEAIRAKKDNREDSAKGGNHYYKKLSYLGRRYTGEVFRQYFSGRINDIRASEMLQSKVDHLPKLETVYFRGVN